MFEEQEIEQRRYYAFMDGFRGLAVLWVILNHANYFFVRKYFFAFPASSIINKIAQVGYLGVDMFFVISGFLITGLLINDLDKKIRLKRFYLRRFFKIVPQYFSAIIVGVFLTVLTPHSRNELSAIALVSQVLFLQNYLPHLSVLNHTWSLAIEEHFYLFYPLLLWFICLFLKKYEEKQRVLIVILIVLIISANIFRYFGQEFGVLRYHFNGGVYSQSTFCRVDALIFGCLLRILEPYYINLGGFFWKNIARLCFMFGIMICGLFVIKWFNEGAWYTYTFAYIASGMLFFAAYLGYDSIVKHKWLIFIGKNSYGIYLWHHILISPYDLLLVHLNLNSFIIAAIVILYIIMSVAVGVFSTLTIENYFLNLRKKYIP